MPAAYKWNIAAVTDTPRIIHPITFGRGVLTRQYSVRHKAPDYERHRKHQAQKDYNGTPKTSSTVDTVGSLSNN